MKKKNLFQNIFALVTVSSLIVLPFVKQDSRDINSINPETISIQNNVDSNLKIEQEAFVSDWSEFSAACQNAIIKKIILEDDISLSTLNRPEYDHIPVVNNKIIDGNGHKFYNYDSSYLEDGKYLITTTNNVVLQNIGFDGVEHFIKNFEYTVTESDEDAALKNISISGIDVAPEEAITNLENEGTFFGEINFIDTGLTSDWVGINNLIIDNNKYDNITFSTGSGIFAGNISTQEQNVVFNSISISNNKFSNMNVTSTDDFLPLIGKVNDNEMIDLNNLVVSNNELNQSEFNYVSVLKNTSAGTKFNSDSIIINNLKNDKSEPLNVALASVAPSNYNLTSYIINTFFDNSDPIIFGDTKASEVISGQTITIINEINLPLLEQIKTGLDATYGKNGWSWQFDDNGNIIGIELSSTPKILVSSSTIYKTKQNNVQKIDLNFQFIYSSFISSDSYLTLKNLTLKVGSTQKTIDDEITTKNGMYSTSFEIKTNLESLNQKPIFMSGIASNVDINNKEFDVEVGNGFVNNADIKEVTSLGKGAIAALSILLILIFFAAITFIIIWTFRKRKEKKRYQQILDDHHYTKNEPLRNNYDEYYPNNYHQDDYYQQQDDYYDTYELEEWEQ